MLQFHHEIQKTTWFAQVTTAPIVAHLNSVQGSAHSVVGPLAQEVLNWLGVSQQRPAELPPLGEYPAGAAGYLGADFIAAAPEVVRDPLAPLVGEIDPMWVFEQAVWNLLIDSVLHEMPLPPPFAAYSERAVISGLDKQVLQLNPNSPDRVAREFFRAVSRYEELRRLYLGTAYSIALLHFKEVVDNLRYRVEFLEHTGSLKATLSKCEEALTAAETIPCVLQLPTGYTPGAPGRYWTVLPFDHAFGDHNLADLNVQYRVALNGFVELHKVMTLRRQFGCRFSFLKPEPWRFPDTPDFHFASRDRYSCDPYLSPFVPLLSVTEFLLQRPPVWGGIAAEPNGHWASPLPFAGARQLRWTHTPVFPPTQFEEWIAKALPYNESLVAPQMAIAAYAIYCGELLPATQQRLAALGYPPNAIFVALDDQLKHTHTQFAVPFSVVHQQFRFPHRVAYNPHGVLVLNDAPTMILNEVATPPCG